MPEVGGEAAHYVNPYSVEQIRDGISQINSDIKYRNQLINKGLENIKRFNPKVIANQYKVLYDKILS
jgi:glycosyltransferase involved in cell wall biosynthesis